MTVLKALASTLLSLLLFVCLTVMGAAVTVNATALNSGFVTTQIDKLDVVTLFNSFVEHELEEAEQPAPSPEVIEGIRKAVADIAPDIKAAINKAISDVYAYLLHGGTLDLRQTLRSSILDPQLAVSILSDIDLSTVARDLLTESLPLDSAEIAGFTVDLTPYADSLLPIVEPWFEEQLTLLMPGLYDFILGDSSTLDLNIPIGSLVTDIGSTLKSAFLASPPSVLAILSPAQLSAAFDEAWAQLLPQMPVGFDLGSSEIVIEQPAEIAQAFQDAEKGLAEAREWVGYYQLGFWGLVGLTALLVLFIILINRNVKAVCRILGGVLATYGITEAAGILVLRGLIRSQLLSISEVPQSLQPWLVQLADSLVNPLFIFAVSCATVGIVLFVVSFLYNKSQETSAIAQEP